MRKYVKVRKLINFVISDNKLSFSSDDEKNIWMNTNELKSLITKTATNSLSMAFARLALDGNCWHTGGNNSSDTSKLTVMLACT